LGSVRKLVLREQGVIYGVSKKDSGEPLLIIRFDDGRESEFVIDDKTIGSVPNVGDIVTVIHEPNEAPLIRGIRVDGRKENLAADGALRTLHKIATEYERSDWSSVLDWIHVINDHFEAFHERKIDFTQADSDLRFQTAVELFSRGYIRTPKDPGSVIRLLLFSNFEPDKYLNMTDVPVAPAQPTKEWKAMFSVHHEYLKSQLMSDERVIHIDDGKFQFGNETRARGGSIIVTNQRIIVIGTVTINLLEEEEPMFAIAYPHQDSKDGLGSDPLLGSIDYLPLARLSKSKVNFGMRKKNIELMFSNIQYTRYQLKRPTHVTVYPGVQVKLSDWILKTDVV